MRLFPKPGRKALKPLAEPNTRQYPEWVIAAGGILGVVLASLAMQRLFPRKVNYVHKDERK
jgi:hypothetical protein